MSMRVNSVNFNIYSNNRVSFKAVSKTVQAKRKEQLEKLGISDKGIEKMSQYSDARYSKAMALLKKGCFEENIEKASRYGKKKTEKAHELLKHRIFDLSLTLLVNLKNEKFKRVIDLSDKGVTSECLDLYSQLGTRELKQAIMLMQSGYTPIRAVYMAKLSPDEKKVFTSLISGEISPDTAYDIVTVEDEEAMCRAFDAIEEGITPSEAINFSQLNEEEKQKARKLLALNMSDVSAIDIAGLPEEDFVKADEMVKDGVFPEYITDIVSIEKNETKMPEYHEYRKRGYSKTSSYSLAKLSEKEIDDLTVIMRKNPGLTDLFKDEYRVEITKVQNRIAVDAVLKKDIYTQQGTKITLTRTFGIYGYQSRSRTEESVKLGTSSFMPDKSDIFKAKYNKKGDIREMTRFITDKKTKAVVGVEHTKESQILPGAFETVYYDINDFKTDNEGFVPDEKIETAVKTKGTPISTVKKNADGTIEFNEQFEYSGCKTQRNYREKRDENGKLLFNSYSYKITDEDNKEILNTERSFTVLNDGSSLNTINGTEYKLTYDDENKTVTVSDGERTKVFNFNDIISYFAKNTIWEVVKKLPVDTLITVNNNVKHWNYCEDVDSSATEYTSTLASGTNTNIIEHETGHFKDYEVNQISDKPEFLYTYLDEMEIFYNIVPDNEQDFVRYCSPKAENNTCGADEFVAETNMILSSYGNSNNHIKIRPQFLVRYFPKSIAKVAEISGKNSRKSLLE